MTDEVLYINKILNSLSENILVKENEKGLMLIDIKSEMTFSL